MLIHKIKLLFTSAQSYLKVKINLLNKINNKKLISNFINECCMYDLRKINYFKQYNSS